MDDMFFVRLMRLARERDIVAHLYYDWREDQYHLCFQRCQVTGEIATSNATIDNRSFISSDRKAQEQIILDILDKAEMELCSTPNGKDAQGGD